MIEPRQLSEGSASFDGVGASPYAGLRSGNTERYSSRMDLMWFLILMYAAPMALVWALARFKKEQPIVRTSMSRAEQRIIDEIDKGAV